MNTVNSELELAEAELAFWLDFARWWRSQHDSSEASRTQELLEAAVRRHDEAERSFQVDSTDRVLN